MKVSILGSGAWGLTLAQVLIDNNHKVKVWSRNADKLKQIETTRKCNFIDNVTISSEIEVVYDLKEILKDCDIVLIATLSSVVESVCQQINGLIENKVYIVNAAKGFGSNNERLSNIIRNNIDSEKRYEVVSLLGPSHAEELILRKITTICAISLDKEAAKLIQKTFSNNYFRIYTSSDELGAEYGAAIKNVIAIAAGAVKGLDLGDNALAALITRGLNEIVNFGLAKNAKLETFLGLTGLGDLLVTCLSIHSRNFKAGFYIAQNGLEAFFKNNTATVEGIKACKAIYEESQKLNIDMPIITAIYRVIYQNYTIDNVIRELLERQLKAEDNN